MKLLLVINICLLIGSIALFTSSRQAGSVAESAPPPAPAPAEPATPKIDLEVLVPDLLARALQLRESGDNAGALQRLDMALQLKPGDVDVLRAKADLLQVTLHLKEAGEIYAALPDGTPLARLNAKLCAEFAETIGKSPTLADVTPLYMGLRQQERFADAVAVLRSAGIEADSIATLVRERIAAHGSRVHHVNVTPEGGCSVNMRYIKDNGTLECLRGLPITVLNIQGCYDIDDVEPLRGAPLKELWMNGTQVSDLSPLQGMPLEKLDLTGCKKITDLSPLSELPLSYLSIAECAEIRDIGAVANCPIEHFRCRYSGLQNAEPMAGWPAERLDIGFCRITDIGPLRGSPVKELYLSGLRLRDYSTLTLCPELTELHIVSGLFRRPEVQEILANLPQLERLNGQPVETIWAMTRDRVLAPCSWMSYGPEWRIATEEPLGGWEKPAFEDAEWTKRHSGFGHTGTDGQGNTLPGKQVWGRHHFTIEELPERPHWRVYCHLKVEIYLNGTPVLSLDRDETPHFVDKAFADSASQLLKPGENVLAVKLQAEGRNPGFDIGIVDKVTAD